MEQLIREESREVERSECERPRIRCGMEVPASAGGGIGVRFFAYFLVAQQESRASGGTRPAGFQL